MRDALRLAFGTLTVLPVRPPRRLDRATAGWAMALAPLVGAVLGALAAVPAWGLRPVLDPLLLAVLLVVLVAALTRLLHWDGLADTADGLGSGRPADAALEVMRRSDTGPFGVFALLAVFGVQVSALAYLVRSGAVLAVVAAVVLGRMALVVACRSGVPAARPEGLGATVAGTVGPGRLAVAALGTALALGVTGAVDDALGWPHLPAAAGAALVWSLAATSALRRRLGGMSGDTFGALVETTTAVALVVLAATVRAA